VIVIAILGILAAVVMPRFFDLSMEAKIGASKGALGAIRSVVALRYSERSMRGTTPYYPPDVTAGDFFDGRVPTNRLNDKSGIVILSGAEFIPTNPFSDTAGWWYAASGTREGRVGAYSNTSAAGGIDTSDW
jgi:type II secretory pathway pseudopilin PulG